VGLNGIIYGMTRSWKVNWTLAIISIKNFFVTSACGKTEIQAARPDFGDH